MISDKLILALEPEAASLWCKQLPQEGFMVDSSDKKKFEDSPGTQYIVVDCGGKFSLFKKYHVCWACSVAVSQCSQRSAVQSQSLDSTAVLVMGFLFLFLTY